MTSRERVLVALDGGEPDRVPCALSFYHLADARCLEDLQRFSFPDASAPYDAAGLGRQVQELHARGLAAGGNLPHLGGELFEAAWRLRGLENFLIDLVRRPAWAHFLLDRLTDLARRNAETMARAGIDVLALDDDVGMPGTMMISPATWREFFKPRLAAIIQAARAVHPALRGTVGRQTMFSSATPAEIRAEVRHRIATLGRAALVLCPAYDINEPDVPWANVAAFLEAVER